MLNWNYLFVGIEQGLIQQSASTSSQSYSHSKDRFFQKKRERRIFSIKGLGTRGIGLVLLRLLKKKNINQNFQFLEKIQDFQIFQKKKNHQSKISIPSKNLGFPKIFKKTKKFKSPKKIFIKFFFRNRKLWSFSTFSSDATSSQLSTLSIHRSMEYVPN